MQQILGPPIANVSFAVMRAWVRSAQRRGVDMLHTARPFDFYRQVFYRKRPAGDVLASLQGQRIVDIGCGYTPFAEDSMFRACHDAGIEFYGVDPLLGTRIQFGLRERALARATGGSGAFSHTAPGLSRALATSAQNLPFDAGSVDEILCSYLLFVWIEDEAELGDILTEFLRVLRPGGVAKLYPLNQWRYLRFRDRRLQQLLERFSIRQTFVHSPHDWRVMPSMLTEMTRN